MSSTVAVKPKRAFTKYVRVPGSYVRDGRMSNNDARKILELTCAAWGMNAVKDSDFEQILAPLSMALRDGTSAERDYRSVSIEIGDGSHSLGELAASASVVYTKENAVRAFARSYNDGELAHRLMTYLSDPDNDVARKQASLDYGVAIEYSHLCFDFSDALADVPGLHLTQMERSVIVINTANKVRTSRSVFAGGTDGGSMQSMSDATASGSAPSLATVDRSKNAAAAPGFERRAGFAPLRG